MGTLEYDHNEGISITGGFVYRGTAIPELYGKYIFGDLALKTAPVRADGRLFYADLQAGTINAFPLPQFGGSAILPNGLTVHGFGQDADGELYALVTNTSANGTGGIVYKLASLRLTIQRSGNMLDISWPAAGGRLQAQTNYLARTGSPCRVRRRPIVSSFRLTLQTAACFTGWRFRERRVDPERRSPARHNAPSWMSRMLVRSRYPNMTGEDLITMAGNPRPPTTGVWSKQRTSARLL